MGDTPKALGRGNRGRERGNFPAQVETQEGQKEEKTRVWEKVGDWTHRERLTHFRDEKITRVWGMRKNEWKSKRWMASKMEGRKERNERTLSRVCP